MTALCSTILNIDFFSDSLNNKPKCIPYPKVNVNGAVTGYDPIIGNPLDASQDPGIKARIFLHDCRAGYWSFISDIRDDLQCDSDFSMKTISTMQQYEGERQASNDFSMGASISGKGSIFGVTVKASAAFSLATNSDEKASEKVLTKYNGELMVAKATCLTHLVSISEFVRPVFTQDFIASLKMMDAACKSNDDAKRKAAVRAFIFEFGTHYAKTTNMGAQLIYERRFSSKAKTKQEENERSECTKMEASASVGVSGVVNEFSASANASNKDCSSNKDKSAFDKGESFEGVRTISRGSRPKELKNWIDSSFTPVAIKRTLNKITDLFKDEWLTANEFYGIDEDLSGSGIKTMFEEIVQKYCGLMLTGILDNDCNIKGKVENMYKTCLSEIN